MFSQLVKSIISEKVTEATQPLAAVAIKVIVKEKAGKEAVEKSLIEANIMKSLDHENVIKFYEVGEKLVLKLADFGLSVQLKESCQYLDQFVGTICYMAPEIFLRVAYDGKKTDLWSCGIILYYMINGKKPFFDLDDKILKHLVISGTFVIPKNMPRWSQDVVIGLLRHDPEERLGIDLIKKTIDKYFEIKSDNLNSKLNLHQMEDEVFTNSAIEQYGVDLNTLIQKRKIKDPRNSVAGLYNILLHQKQKARMQMESTHSASKIYKWRQSKNKKKTVFCSVM
ncbi:serine/threonine-protein kinase NIM1-like [Octopus sinensis]|uniref:Serine/threonine-protein kinase NIM1-like n=1 Tax=Octopus sinensis TaxID=2607531 RepID=A0A6P7U2F0_9MOLL|nr:serine/threonine-protein kinase NIM1-like [Octopus sinensis]